MNHCPSPLSRIGIARQERVRGYKSSSSTLVYEYSSRGRPCKAGRASRHCLLSLNL